ncbi:MAG: heat shock protein Hsp20 [Polaromonas sp.]|nr:heat shock protein Hsp20 [Polaromonas sp.]
MNPNQQANPAAGQQTGQPNGTGYQSGQTDAQTSQPSQDDRYGSNAGAAQRTGGQARAQAGREVSSAGQHQGRQAAQGVGAATLLPPVDIYEDESGFTLMADLPGVAKEQLVVRVTGDNLLIEGAATVPVAGNMELVYGEVSTPQYRRSFTLSRELDPGKIEASLNNGVLRLTIPKAEEAKPRRIEVNVG